MKQLPLRLLVALLAFLLGVLVQAGAPALVLPADSAADRRHRLYEAAQSIGSWRRGEVMVELGLSGDPYGDPEFRRFVSEHTAWMIRHSQFCKEVGSPGKAKEYVRRHSTCCPH